jgi:hypothetical protein
MGFGSWWHWLLLLLICVVIYFQLLFALRSRKLIMTEPRQNQFFHPNLAWGCLVPWVNFVWTPLTVFAVEKTIAKGDKKSAYFNDRVLVTCGRFLKYWLVACLVISFVRYLFVYYAPQLLTAKQMTVIPILITILDIAYFVVFIGTIISIIWFPIRLGKFLAIDLGSRGNVSPT